MMSPSLAEFKLLNPEFVDDDLDDYFSKLIDKHWRLLKKNKSSFFLIEQAVYEFVKADICTGPHASLFALSEKNRMQYLLSAKEMIRRGNQRIVAPKCNRRRY